MHTEPHRVVVETEARPSASEQAGPRRGPEAPSRERRRRRDLGSGLALGVVVVTALCHRALHSEPAVASAPAAAPLLPVQTLVAKEVEGYSVRTAYAGELLARRRSALAFVRIGAIVDILVDEGDVVTAGRELARVACASLDAARRSARAEVAERSARLAELLAGPREEVMEQARARLEQAEVRRKRTEDRARRVAAILAADAISDEEHEATASAAEEAAAACRVARSALDELEAGPRAEILDAARAQLAGAEAALAEVEALIAASVLRAPYDGVVARRLRDEGDVARPGEPVLEVVEQGAYELRVGVPPSVATSMVVGMHVPVHLDGVEREACVAARLPTLDPITRTVQLVLSLSSDEEDDLFAGQVARIAWSRFVEESGIWVPTSSLTRGERGLWSLYRIDPDGDGATARRLDVEVLHLDGPWSFVRGLVADGDVIVAAGVERLADGQRVEPIASAVATLAAAPDREGAE